MIGTRNNVALLGIGGLALFTATACNVSLDIGGEDGSGVPETVSYDFDSFDKIDIGGTFAGEITIAAGAPTVMVTVDDNLVDRLEVEVKGDELSVGFKSGSINPDVEPTVVVTVPSLTELDLSGASTATVGELDESKLEIDLSGASEADVQGVVEELQIDASGASSFTMAGTVDVLKVDLSGAGDADFSDADVSTATVDLSGASAAEFDALDDVSGDLSGGSSLVIPNGTTASINTSGGSDISRS